MHAVEAAYLTGLLTGALMGVPTGLFMAYVAIPRVVDFWVGLLRSTRRPHGR